MRMDRIKTYPEMNDKIVSLLRMSDEPVQLYAAQYIEELKQIANHYEEQSKGWWLAACDSKEEIEKLRDATPKWIPVSEQLPPLDEDVLVFAYGSMMRVWMLEKPCLGDACWQCEDGYWEDVSAATHWMPLPKFSKGGET